MKNKNLLSGIAVGALSLFLCAPLAALAADDSSSSVPTTSSANVADTNKQAGEAFMEANKHKPKIVTLPSGLQYEIITAGTGKKPSKDSTVTVDYEGRLINGQVFDSSYQRGQPATFPVTGVIPGWQEALPLMNTGATWMLYIPAELAYGERGAGGVIGPNQPLVFKVHLISIK